MEADSKRAEMGCVHREMQYSGKTDAAVVLDPWCLSQRCVDTVVPRQQNNSLNPSR